MPPTESAPTHKPDSWLGQIIALANQIDQMTTGGIISATGGALALSLLFGNFTWVMFGLTFPLLVYRLYRERLEHAERKRFRLIEEVAAIKESISRREIPEADKRFLLDQLDRELAAQERKALPHTNEKEKS